MLYTLTAHYRNKHIYKQNREIGKYAIIDEWNENFRNYSNDKYGKEKINLCNFSAMTTCGDNQGAVIGPLFFILYINDKI